MKRYIFGLLLLMIFSSCQEYPIGCGYWYIKNNSSTTLNVSWQHPHNKNPEKELVPGDSVLLHKTNWIYPTIVNHKEIFNERFVVDSVSVADCKNNQLSLHDRTSECKMFKISSWEFYDIRTHYYNYVWVYELTENDIQNLY